jgi:poly-gamma-glutamate synthesis protein (capsule biosynthesis protein)
MCAHHHSLRGVEIHRGKPIFYGLGTLVHHFTTITASAADRAARVARFGERSSYGGDDDFPLFPYRPDARKTGIAVTELGADGTIAAGFIPAHMAPDGSTAPLRADDPLAAEVACYIERLSAQSGFATRFERARLDSGHMLLRIT